MGTNIIQTVVTAITSFFSGIGTGFVDLFNSMVIVPETNQLTDLATWGLVFIGLGFAIGVVRALFRRLS